MGEQRVLVACSHGTRSAAGREAADRLRSDVAAARAGLEVRAAHVDVHGPTLDDVVDELRAAGRAMVVVPLLLSSGYHVKVDIGRAVEKAADLAVATPALGPEPVLVDVLVERLKESGAPDDAAVVLAAAGSSDPGATADVDTTAGWLTQARGGPVTCGFLAAARPTVAEAVAQLRAAHPDRPVALASYLLAPGLFSVRLDAAGADHVAAPLAPHPALTALVLRRYDEALTRT